MFSAYSDRTSVLHFALQEHISAADINFSSLEKSAKQLAAGRNDSSNDLIKTGRRQFHRIFHFFMNCPILALQKYDGASE
jgi:hypothetical protein